MGGSSSSLCTVSLIQTRSSVADPSGRTTLLGSVTTLGMTQLLDMVLFITSGVSLCLLSEMRMIRLFFFLCLLDPERRRDEEDNDVRSPLGRLEDTFNTFVVVKGMVTRVSVSPLAGLKALITTFDSLEGALETATFVMLRAISVGFLVAGSLVGAVRVPSSERRAFLVACPSVNDFVDREGASCEP